MLIFVLLSLTFPIISCILLYYLKFYIHLVSHSDSLLILPIFKYTFFFFPFSAYIMGALVLLLDLEDLSEIQM